MPISKWIRRFLLRLIRDPPFLLATLLMCVTAGPFIILGFFIETPNWSYWFEGLYFILEVLPETVDKAFFPLLSPSEIGITLVALGFVCTVAKTGVDRPLAILKQRLLGVHSKFDSFAWDVEFALWQEKFKVIGTSCAKKMRRKYDFLEKREKLKKGPYDEQKELAKRFYDGRMKYFGYQNYLHFLLKNGEELAQHLRASVSEQYPAGDPLLIEEIALARMILKQETRKLDEQLKDGTWG
ncbi:uncharacterized protein LOC121678536 [Alosa sapidissima]|uniref:uncharacterized protein LOC121678536 n=1 Tax=Alosa sapidissima TaxID=34773 RepID=UPI001C083765|nr:uncharacterized protein LOC121678536 [Alosa sapidissima]